MTEISLRYGRSSRSIAIPDGSEWDMLEPRRVEPLPEPRAAVLEALRRPIDSPPLREIVGPEDHVAVLVNDVTRLARSDVFLPVLISELNSAGVADDRIFIVFALGIHRKQTAEERRAIVGDEIARRIRMADHDCFDRSQLVHIGRTTRGNEVWVNRRVREATKVILTGEIIYHLIAGYSGGRKSLIPGVAGAETTTFNHKLILDPQCRAGLLDGNPAHEDLLEACRLFNPSFLLNVVLNPQGDLTGVFCGHYEAAHRAGCAAVDRLYGVEVEKIYDVVLASSGGFPVDIDLRQAHKGIENAARALRHGGVLIYFSECKDGAGIRAFEEWVARYTSSEAMAAALRANFVVGGHKAYWVTRLGEQFRIFLASSLPDSFVRQCHLHPAPDPDSILREIAMQSEKPLRIGVMPYANFTLPLMRRA